MGQRVKPGNEWFIVRENSTGGLSVLKRVPYSEANPRSGAAMGLLSQLAERHGTSIFIVEVVKSEFHIISSLREQ